jgi:hypothetical protein
MVFHLQTNGASERVIRKMSQVHCALVRPDQLDWPRHLPMTKFTINSSVSTSTGFTPFELTYRYLLQIIQSVGESSFARVQDFANDVWDMVIRAHNTIIASRVNQTHQANQWQQGDNPLLEVGRKPYLSTENLNLPKAQAQKLMPKYIGPYETISCKRETSHYTLTLPDKLLKCRIHPTFHTKLLRPAILNDNEHFPNHEATFFYDFGNNPESEWLVNSIVDHKFTNNSNQFNILWDTGETTHEPLSCCKDLTTLDNYLELHGVT